MGIAVAAGARERGAIQSIYTTHSVSSRARCIVTIEFLNPLDFLVRCQELVSSPSAAGAASLLVYGFLLIMAVPQAQPTSPPLASASHTTTTSHSQGQGDTFATTTGDSTTALASRVDESDLDPAAFLKSVRELSEKREREDSERVRRLEEEIEKGRQERAKRRQGGW